ncbi:hypothetical protein [Thalassobaculum salexigens]|uniref:hypothetical protein n=1 Tax=Thalassobaculum salexigens TaxID=455360 RepID=UPI0012EC5F6B|nr:hypothetical protein [Thalassobaculum salexigens]
MSFSILNPELIESVHAALGRLAAAREMNDRLLVDLPVMYPSGATAVVQVEQNRDRVLVSDLGHGLIEAEMAAAEEFFGPAARRTADEFSVNFDGYAIFALWVPIGRLEAAIACVANASCRAAAEAIQKASEMQVRNQNEQIFERVSSVFGKNMVIKKTEIEGRHISWSAHNVIVFPNKSRAIFEYMTGHANSVSNRYMMFSDIKSADHSISLNSVVNSIDELGEKAQMISDVANIVPIKATDDQYRRFAKAS